MHVRDIPPHPMFLTQDKQHCFASGTELTENYQWLVSSTKIKPVLGSIQLGFILTGGIICYKT
jgi:hypothetical protein